MGEGAARAITIASMVLTAASLAVAFFFARKRSRIRVGFDLARAVVGVAAILVMAEITQVATPGMAIGIAIAVGLGLGFAQGSSLDVSSEESGFYATRSPVGIALWGMGILLMQGAGIAARTGTVQVGQTIAWFSTCLGVGLIMGRGGPVRRAAATAGIAGLLAAVVLPVALVFGAETGAYAVSEPSADDLCAFAPYGSLDLDAGDGMADASVLGPATVDGVKFCARAFGGHIEDGQRFNADVAAVYLYPSTEAATAAFDESATAVAFAMPDVSIGDRYMETGGPDDFFFLAIGQRGPFMFTIDVTDWDGVPGGSVANARDAMREIDANVAPYVTDTGVAPLTTVEPGGGETTTTIDSQPATGTTEPTAGAGREPGTEADDPIEPEDAAGQAIAGLIAAAAIGLISWAEAAAEIEQILSGTSNSSLLDPKTGPGIEEPDEADPESVKEDPATKQRSDPCAFELDRFRKALAKWQWTQSQISALENEYALTANQIESQGESEFLGAAFDVAMLGVDIRRGGGPPSSGMLRSMVDSWGQSWARSISSQMIQRAATGQAIDTTAIGNKAAQDATGVPALMEDGNPASGAFGTFLSESLTRLMAANRSYDYLKFMDTLAAPGAIADPKVMKLIERSSFESFQERIGPWVGVVFKYVDFWHKNQKWGEGVERRAGMRQALLTPIRQRIDELKVDLEYLNIERDGWRRDLASCRSREETG